MTSRARLARLVASLLLVPAAACTQASEGERLITADDASDLVGRVPGIGIASPNAKPSATYLTARRIDTLQAVGALNGPLGALAQRVDGIIANQPPDSRFSVSELLTIEKPGFIETLFPAEKAALPALWALLETTNAAPVAVAAPPLVGLSEVDISTPSGAPIPPANLAIATLPARLLASANRLELTRDDDADPSTVTVADLNAAIATPGPYTPAEVADFQAIKVIFMERAGTSLRAQVRVTNPGTSSATLASWGPATLTFEQEVAYTEHRSATFTQSSSASLSVTLQAQLSRKAVIALPANNQLVLIDETTEEERVFGGGVVESVAGSATVEVWSGGVRVGSFRAALPALKSTGDWHDLQPFADHRFVAAIGGAVLFRNVVSAARVDSYPSSGNLATFTYDAAPKAAPPGVEPAALAALATPGFGVAAGRYQINVPSVGLLAVDLYPEGVLRITRSSGAAARASLYIWSTTQFDVGFPDKLRGVYDPATKRMTIFFDGGVRLFDGALLGSMRTG